MKELTQDDKEALSRGEALQHLVNTDGWKVLLEYYQGRLQGFINEVMLSGKPLESFSAEKDKLAGIRELLAEVDNAIEQYGDIAKE